MDWILENHIEDIKNEIKSLENDIKYHETEMKKYKDIFNTSDKFEVKNHEYHRTFKSALGAQVTWLKDQLKEIELMKQEDVRHLEEAEQDIQENKKRAYCK